MNGDKLIKYLGYSSNHPDLLAFLQQQEVDITLLNALNAKDKKPARKKAIAYRQLGITLQFEMDFPEQAEKQRRSDPEGRSVIKPEDFRIKNPVGEGPFFLDHIVFNKPVSSAASPEKPLVLPFGLQFMDNQTKLQRLFGHKHAHGDPGNPYYEEDESDYFHKDFKVNINFKRFDPEEKLQEIRVSLKK